MRQKSDFAFGFAMGWLAGAGTVFLIGFAFVVSRSLIDAEWLKKWETLIAGGLAVSAAVPTVYYLRRQIAQVYALAEEARARELLAARAVLPVTLSRICSYAAECTSALLPKYVRDGGDIVDRAAFVAPALPSDDLSNLERCIRYGDEPLQQAISKLLAQLQVQSSRLRGFAEEMRPGGEAFRARDVYEFLADAIEMYARSSALFDFARQESDQVSDTPKLAEMQSAANILGVRRMGFLNVHLLLEGRYK